MSEKAVLIANPTAQGGRVGGMLHDVAARVRVALGSCEILRTGHQGHGAELAAQAVKDGVTYVISLGGDGTHGEVARGVHSAQREPGAAHVAFLPAGSGGDFCRLLSGGQDLNKALDALANPTRAIIDLGHARYQTQNGTEERVFLNLASAGMGALVDERVNASSKPLGGQVAFFVETLSVLRTYVAPCVRVHVDGVDEGVYSINLLTVANGRFAGGGMMFAPNAKLADGLLDVTVIEQESILSTLTISPQLYTGTHLSRSNVSSFRGERIELTTVGGAPARLEFDGEPHGQAYAEFTVKKAALSVLGLRSDVI